MSARGKRLTFFALSATIVLMLVSSMVLPGLASSRASPSPRWNLASPVLASPLDDEECNATIHPTVLTIDALSYPSTFDLSASGGSAAYGYVMPSVDPGSCMGAAAYITISVPSTSAFGVSWNAADCIVGYGFWTEIIGGVTTYVYWCGVGAIEPGDYSTANFEVYYSGAESGPACQTSGTLDLLVYGYNNAPALLPSTDSASMSINVICRSTITTSSTTSTTSSTTSTSTAGTAPCTTIDTNKDECIGTPTDGSLTATANIVSLINVSIASTSATGSVTIDITDYAGNAYTYTGPDPSLGGGAGYYFVIGVSGATDGTAQVCITPSNGDTTMDYYQPSSGPWTQAAPLSFPDGSICGVIPVSALSGTPIVVGTTSTTTTSSSTTSSTTTSATTTASTPTAVIVPGVPEFPLAIGIGIALALALPALLLVKARKLRNS